MNRRTFFSAVTGYVEAQNLLVERRFAALKDDRLPTGTSAAGGPGDRVIMSEGAHPRSMKIGYHRVSRRPGDVAATWYRRVRD
jgi:hypothetical protein